MPRIPDQLTRTLGDWQQAAVGHFNELSSTKKDKGLPLFILEHPFTPLQLQLIKGLLQKNYTLGGINRSYWLLWVIFATEIGYEYTGEEYWQSFQESVHNWDFDQRQEIRWAFKEFRKKYSGIIPAGTWANHFSIISLPITHAILPKDLQYYFAKLLYDCRYKLKTIFFSSPVSIGKLLSANSYLINSTRFLNFLQQEELVGRIALALLKDEMDMPGSELLYQPTLKRIVADLEQERNAKEWIQETRKELKPRISGTASATAADHPFPSTREVPTKRPLALKPVLKLFQVDQNSWTIVAEIPRFTDLPNDASMVTHLKKTRVQIPSAKSHWLPGETLLHNALKKRLVLWPGSEPLLKFETPDAILDSIVNNDFTLSPGPWLFSVGTDGTATEIEGRILRPGKKYIALFSDLQPVSAAICHEVNVDCTGVTARGFVVADVVSPEQEAEYKHWGFKIFKTVTVWPAGLSARAWDGEGTSEWLTTESPCFGITHDYDLSDLQVSIGTDTLTLKAKPPGEVLFIKISPLQAGNHLLFIKTSSRAQQASEGVISLNVREPSSWSPGVTLNNGLTAFLDPNDQNLDAFLLGKTGLHIYGPPDRPVTIQADIYHNHKMETFKSPSIPLPFTSEKLKAARLQILQLPGIDLAYKARLRISCEGIGNRDFILTRDVRPFRWIYRLEHNIPFLRLIDETDNDEKTQLSFFDLLRPDTETDISQSRYLQNTSIKGINGLFLAHKSEYSHAVIISTLKATAKNFDGLIISPVLKNDTAFNLLPHLKMINLWYSAQCIGSLARLHQEKIIEVLVEKLYTHLCGSGWAKEEMNFLATPDFSKALTRLAERIENASIANITSYRLALKTPAEMIYNDELKWFTATVERCNLCKQESMISSAIAFASNPLSLLGPSDLESEARLRQLTQHADLLRACRLFVLGTSRLTDAHRNYPLLISARFK